LTDKFIVALVGPPFGLDGFVKVRPLSGEVEHLLKLKSITVRRGESEQRLEIEECKASGTHVLVRFTGITTPEKAKTMTGAQLLAGRDEAAPLQSGEFYIEDLKGLPVLAEAEKEAIGSIKDIVEGGGGDLVEVRLHSGEIKLIPFRKEFFPEINPKEGSVTLKNLWILE